jgi:hypothetical protein
MNYLEQLDTDFIEFLKFEDRPFRAKFIPSKIWNDLDKYKNDATGLRNYFKKWRFRIVWMKEKKTTTRILVGGGYYTDDQNSELEIWTSPDTSYNKFKFTNRSWDRFKFRVIQVCMHELIHCRQYYNKSEFYSARKVYYKKTGNPRIDDNKDYHSGTDEIEAYAHCIYLDFKMRRATIPVAELIRNPKQHQVSKNLNGIKRLFKADRFNEVVPLLLRKILVWERKYSSIV